MEKPLLYKEVPLAASTATAPSLRRKQTTQHRPPPKKMAGLSWTAVTLSLLLYVGNCSAQLEGPDQNQHEGPDQNQHEGPDQNQLKGPDPDELKELKELVNEIWNNYIPSYKVDNKDHYPMFSLAVSIPYDNNLKMYDISGITDLPQKVKATVLKCEVYKSKSMVAATVLKWPDVKNQCPKQLVQWDDFPNKKDYKPIPWIKVNGVADDFTRADHAEYRTLTDFSTLTKKLNPDDFMLFYVRSSPCVSRCTNPKNELKILNKIKKVMKWNNYAVVFSNVFRAGGEQADEKERKEALVRLGESIGLKNIFRCGKKSCSRCYDSETNDVVPHCYKYSDKSDPSNNLPSTSFIEMRNDL